MISAAAMAMRAGRVSEIALHGLRGCRVPLARAEAIDGWRAGPLLRSLAPSASHGGLRTYLSDGGDGGGRGGSGFQPMQHRVTLRHLGFRIVPQQMAYVIERFGKYNAVLHSGLHLLIPFVDRIRYAHSLKERTLDIKAQNAITRDNVSIVIDGVLYVRVVDPYKASYGVEDPMYAVLQLAQTTMRSEIGKITLDKSFEERDALNAKIVDVINDASVAWGMECLRYEIRDIQPPVGVRAAMELQAEAERRKRAKVLESEGEKASAINMAEGEKQRLVLASEAAMQDRINKAIGEARAIEGIAEATAVGVERVARATEAAGAKDAIALRVAEQYIHAFANLAKETNTVVIPSDVGNPGAMLAQAMAVFKATSPGPGGAPTPAQQAGEDEADEGAWDGEDGAAAEDEEELMFVRRNPSLR